MKNGSLHDAIYKAYSKNLKISNSLQKYILRDILTSLQELKTLNGLCHRDIKPENFVFDENFNVKLINFGLSCPLSQNISHKTGTKEFCAPEVNYSKLNERYYSPEMA